MTKEVAIALGSFLLLISISVVFFRLGKTLPPRQRLAASAHGALVASILPYGLAVEALSTGYAPESAQLPVILQVILAAASIVYSVWVFRDKRLVHLLHLITIALAVPFAFFASIAIVGWT